MSLNLDTCCSAIRNFANDRHDVANVTYHALAKGGKEPASQGGNIVLSSSLAWFM